MKFSVSKTNFLFQDNAISLFAKKYQNYLAVVGRRGRGHGRQRRIMPYYHPRTHETGITTVNYKYDAI